MRRHPSGPVRSVRDVQQPPTADALAKRESRKLAGIEAAARHERELQEREDARIAEAERRRSIVDLGTLIGQGDR